ncbi:MAG: ABC transporter permease [Terriglobales bacterium]
MKNLLQDVRYGVRMLLKNPIFAVASVLTLALGLGGNTVIFTVVYGVLLRPLPFPQPDRLQTLWTGFPNGDHEGASLPDFVDWRQQAQSFDGMAAFTLSSATLGGVDQPERLIMGLASADFSKIVNTSPTLGRFFNAAEAQPSAAKVVMLSYGFWQRRFAGRTDVVGQTLQINSIPYMVIGVTPLEVDALRKIDMWAPLALQVDPNRRRADFLRVIGRLKPGVSTQQAQAEMSAIAQRLQQQYPVSNKNIGILTVPLQQDLVQNARPILISLWAAVGFVLLIVVANLSSLLLARNAARQKEMAMRVTLGCNASRLVRQLLTESVLLALLGGGLGIALAVAGLDGLVKVVPQNFWVSGPPRIDAPVFLFSFVVTLVTGFLFGLLPALSAARVNLNDSLKEGSRSFSGTRQGWRRALVISEISLSLVLLVGTVLMVRTLKRLQEVDLGFNPDRLLTCRLMLPAALYKDQQSVALFNELLGRIRSLPQVQSASAINDLYLGGGTDYLSFVVQGLHENDNTGEGIDAEPRAFTPELLKTMGIPLLRGRPFTDTDNAQAPPVALINQRLINRYFPGQDLVGKYIAFSNPGGQFQWHQIVGIIGDVRQDGVSAAPYPEIIYPFAQSPDTVMTLVVRYTGDSSILLGAIRQQAKALDASAPIYAVRTMAEITAASTAAPSMQTYVLGGFAALGLLLAMLGIYSVMAQTVTQRTGEFGVRMALGASNSEILKLVLSNGLRMTAAGLLFGMAGAWIVARFVASFLYGVSAHDPLTLAGVAVVLSAASVLACYIPARRAVRLDIISALRCE